MKELTHTIIGLAMKIHRAMGCGYLESVYHRCMEIELCEAGVTFESHKALPVRYGERVVGTYEADLVVTSDAGPLILELKAVETLVKAHEVQLVHYLTATGIDDGLLLNFGSESLQQKRKYRTLKPLFPDLRQS